MRTCSEYSKKKLSMGALIVLLNDAHHWTRDASRRGLPDPDVPQDESRASPMGYFS